MSSGDTTACRIKRLLVAFLCAIIAMAVVVPTTVSAQKSRKTVRVGWYDSAYCYFDSQGRRSGIAYEYQQKIAAYTGWDYEYVESSWPDLLRMLAKGEIDLLSDVSYTEERAEQMLFSSLAMGSESYYIFVNANNPDISSEDLSSLNGKRIGVNMDSVQEGFLKEWASTNNLSPVIVPLSSPVYDSINMMARGEIDAYTTLDSYGAESSCIPICKVGSSDFYFAINKDREDLLGEVNSAMSSILDEDAYFNQKISSCRRES